MKKETNIPHDWPEIEAQVREAIIAMASILQTFGPQDDGATVNAFLGQPVETAGKNHMSSEEIDSIDITRHGLHRHARAAWCYANQLDGWEDFTGEHAFEIACGLLHGGYALTDSENEPTGLDPANDLPLRRILQTAEARWFWANQDSELTVRQLSLLSNMSETTVRSSLSKEGFKLEPSSSPDEDKSSYRLSANDALQWLRKRRGFIPNAAGPSPDRQRKAARETLADPSVPFPLALKRAAELIGLSDTSGSGVDSGWYAGLVEGRKVAPDVAALVALADALDVPRADFAARGVRHLLELEGA
ncbi:MULTISPECIES: hypothetical protein [unclassified Yoonia]|uniref:hypothetical protein n=1 Tax=unclassified Yoonia TaxID=2629118 RepID=UPI002AFF72CD|nr:MULTISPECIES: hypothetical protein [unclassified Yoonia]